LFRCAALLSLQHFPLIHKGTYLKGYVFMNQISSANVTANNIKSHQAGLSFFHLYNCWSLYIKARHNGPLNNSLNIFSLLEIVFFIKPLFHPRTWPFSLEGWCNTPGVTGTKI
jgi:hypothetical protein